MRVLFVKLTSMGDLIHALPALTDAKNAYPDIVFDWVIEKNFSDVAQWHSAVKKIIPTSHREWRKHPWQALTSGELKNFWQTLRHETYDFVIDGQSSTKSVIVSLLSKGFRCGLDKNSAREWTSAYAYQKQVFAPKTMHAIPKLRQLFAESLNYPCPTTPPDYGINHYNFSPVKFDLPKPYLYFVHNASWQTKLWPELYWHTLINYAEQQQLNVVLPWGNETEKLRAQHLAEGHSNAYVLPFCTLSEHAYILKNSMGAICCDTGLSHLASALDVKTITMYGPTNADIIGTVGNSQKRIISSFPCTSCHQKKCDYNKTKHPDAPCMANVTPEFVWQRFLAM